ncbi:hypothetical protein CHS0354_008170 [Potamilus streckersoni]|uniref:Uncharacterized protein n=1 Tax=Potamilus streckersoni TaxID=2493646 RepID=A0AAE0RX38_9BIVA|nr:hypothetical protein CHS0354_008170 [Potamilus streckersoni]
MTAMDREVNDYILFLKENVSELQRLGKEWGMEDEEINRCIDKALENSPVSPKNQTKSGKNYGRKAWIYIRLLLKAALCSICTIIVLLSGILILTSMHKPTERFVGKTLEPYGYMIFRFIRLATLPLHQILKITKLYDAECVINNPFFVEETPECWVCSNTNTVKEINTDEFKADKLALYIRSWKPVMFKSALKRNVTYQDLRELYLSHKVYLDSSVYILESSHLSIQSLQEMFGEDREAFIKEANEFYFIWESRKVASSISLRQLFPRPSFMPLKSEITLDKTVIIHGPGMNTSQLPATRDRWYIYTQSSGTRRVAVTPAGDCKMSCSTMLIILQPGDTLLFTSQMWWVQLLTNGDEISVGYVVSFTP